MKTACSFTIIFNSEPIDSKIPNFKILTFVRNVFPSKFKKKSVTNKLCRNYFSRVLKISDTLIDIII